jgi:hypothetical protein
VALFGVLVGGLAEGGPGVGGAGIVELCHARGCGGGASCSNTTGSGSAGGSGIVIIRYIN